MSVELLANGFGEVVLEDGDVDGVPFALLAFHIHHEGTPLGRPFGFVRETEERLELREKRAVDDEVVHHAALHRRLFIVHVSENLGDCLGALFGSVQLLPVRRVRRFRRTELVSVDDLELEAVLLDVGHLGDGPTLGEQVAHFGVAHAVVFGERGRSRQKQRQSESDASEHGVLRWSARGIKVRIRLPLYTLDHALVK